MHRLSLLIYVDSYSTIPLESLIRGFDILLLNFGILKIRKDINIYYNKMEMQKLTVFYYFMDLCARMFFIFIE